MDRTVSPGRTGTPKRLVRAGLAAGMAVALASCASFDPPAITKSNGNASDLRTVEFVAANDETELRASFRSALAAAMTEHGYRLTEGGAAVADFAISVRPASVTLTGSGEAAEVDTIRSEKRQHRSLFGGCKATRLRASLAMITRETGVLAYRGEAEVDGCEIDDEAVTGVARLLVEDMAKSIN